MEGVARLLEAISALLWPMAAIVIMFLLLPVIRAVIAKREFSLEIGGFKFSAQKATEKIQQQLADLQAKIVALETGGEVSGKGEKPFAEGPIRRLSILWVDDHPSNNAFEAVSFRRDGHTVHQVSGTREALGALRAGGVDIVISDMGHLEDGARDPEAGMKLLREMRGKGDETPLAFYTTRATARRWAGEARELGAITMTDSFTTLCATIKRRFTSAEKGG
ncbi:response regulator [Pikeienuella piscinae]|uniref:Response regulator n=1 Tax=Pikeienuella piscinae TaxID=2748098 RepID=A0A7M3T6A4_9RHOB|nr:response regulator [Pikeienuella piscinae]QIE57535.1 response regulator [Pikeienuella piscinae]